MDTALSFVVGLVGPMRSGKETVQKRLVKNFKDLGFRVDTHAFSDVIRETCDLWHQPRTRELQQGMVVKFRELCGPDVLLRVVVARVMKSKSQVIIVDGLRWPDSDYAVIKDLPNSFLAYINAPVQIRWQRSLSNSDKPDEANATLEEFMAKDRAPNEVDIPKFKKLADHIIDNSVNDLDNLYNQVDDMFKVIINR